tara:strand:+ start:1332 stop:2408 length:1077 start_codon:yes stop_codon:yes gene_type:complete
MKVGKKKFSSIWFENNKLYIIDQTLLPFKFKIKTLKTLDDFCFAIKNMMVRGAPLIGVTGAFALALEVKRNPKKQNIYYAVKKILKTRPTAVNLSWALKKIQEKILNVESNLRSKTAMMMAEEIRSNDIDSCKRIGKFGYELIKKIYVKKKKKINILTHCNAGWLATVDWGTALSPIFYAHKKGIPLHIWVDETRPRNQGALLTSWELKNENVPHTVIVDNAGGHLMQNSLVDLCLVGSDRTTINGDVCNKIGTYLKALSAYENKIPFFVALPTSTIDENTTNSNEIPIETRSGDELSKLFFKKSNRLEQGEIFVKGTQTFNPSFDVTPSRFVSKLITENGICNSNKRSIKKILYPND